jgi:hypothetical protein
MQRQSAECMVFHIEKILRSRTETNTRVAEKRTFLGVCK